MVNGMIVLITNGVPQKSFKNRCLIIFGRYPVPGRTKTRLIPALGPAGAAELQREMTEAIIKTAMEADVAPVRFCYCGGSARQVRRWIRRPGVHIERQSGDDLGRRMHHAVVSALKQGCRQAVLMGTDVPLVGVEHLTAAFGLLETNDVVLGPSRDGGYWLVGLRQPADLFTGIAWGTDRVLEQTLAAARRLKLRTAQLTPLQDVDHTSDLAQLPRRFNRQKPYLSVVIPALNEAAAIEAAIESARCDDSEIIVADGGSRDRTVARAQAAGARVISSPAGRALQQNRGAGEAGGRVLLFLHADSRLPDQFSRHLFETLMDSRTVAGAFQFKTDWPRKSMRLIEKAANVRSARFQMPYGDQGIFLRKDLFNGIGGFTPVAIAEDLFLIRRLWRMGRIGLASVPVVTSGRRWRTIGVWRATLINYLIAGGCLMGVPTRYLAPLYSLWNASRRASIHDRKAST
jgi:rSAM/selenodomain-associated transferase 2/rSAM/selenodomain-associated transferase 1